MESTVEGNGIDVCFDPSDPRSIAAPLNSLSAGPGILRLRHPTHRQGEPC
jgi:hypothetical protein